ncbi:MAG TPA: SRPBCC family protein [Acidobacteriota bacterium]|nr:SRPBCC family protein [Acidobacteriota bacterium]
MNTNQRNQNMGSKERYISEIVGGTLLLYGTFKARPKVLKLLSIVSGAGLLYCGLRGKSALQIGKKTVGALPPNAVVGHKQSNKIDKAVTINKSPEELFAFWRDFKNLPRMMKHVESVEIRDERVSHWKVKLPAGKTVEWDAEIYNEIPNELIAWRTLEGSEVNHAGSVQFKPAPNRFGTEVRVEVNYALAPGKLGAILSKMISEVPEFQLQEDLRRFKQLMETGEIPRTEGQPEGGKRKRTAA